MKIVSQEGMVFEVGVIGYEFPNEEKDLDDANWLRISLGLGKKENISIWQGPILQTFEVNFLAKWLNEPLGQKKEDELDFLEPNLAFKKMALDKSDEVCLRVYLSSECKFSNTFFSGNDVQSEDKWIDLIVSNNILQRASQELKSEVEKYPVRGISPIKTFI